MLTTDRFRQDFVVAIRWRGPDPKVQLQTKHSGFKTAHDAARFAGSNCEGTAHSLVLGPRGAWPMSGKSEIVSVPQERIVGRGVHGGKLCRGRGGQWRRRRIGAGRAAAASTAARAAKAPLASLSLWHATACP